MKIKPIKFTEIPAWTYEGKEPSVYTFFESIALAGLEEKSIRLDANTQRALLGSNVFGKQSLFVAHGEVVVTRKVCFGTDFEQATYSATTIRDAVARARKLVPGYTFFVKSS